MTLKRKVDLLSDDANDIVSKPPKWIIRWGVTMLFSILVILLAGSSLFSYPDIISGPVVITSGNLPIEMISRSSGKIMLFVNEADCVIEQEVLAYIENSVSYEAYLKLKATLSDSISSVYKIREERLSLGSLQEYYQNLLKFINEYNDFCNMDYYNLKIQQMEIQFISQSKNIKSLERQVLLNEEQLKIASKMFERDSILFNKNALTSTEFDKSRIAYLSIIQQHESSLEALISSQIGISQIKQNIINAQKEKRDLKREYCQSINSAFEVMKAKIAEWEHHYLLISPISGRVSLTEYWQNNQNINIGELLMTIIPKKTSHIIGKIYLPLVGAGKVETGQKVNIKLDNYPFMEFGLLQTTVTRISTSHVSQNNLKKLVVSLDFKDNLITNYHTKIPVNEEMTGTAEIIVKDQSVLKRIASPIKYLLKK